MTPAAKTVKVKLLFADEGSFHHEEVEVPAAALGDYERLIDFVREDPAVLKHLHVNMERLVSASR